jgi:hypothetical protein
MMVQRPSRTDHPTAAARLLDAVCAREFDDALGCLREDAVLRAVLPPRFLEATGREEIVGWFRTWFGAANEFEVVDRSHAEVAGRARLTWRFGLSPHPGNGDPRRHVIEQTLFCDEEDGAVTAIDLLCSGFRMD